MCMTRGSLTVSECCSVVPCWWGTPPRPWVFGAAPQSLQEASWLLLSPLVRLGAQTLALGHLPTFLQPSWEADSPSHDRGSESWYSQDCRSCVFSEGSRCLENKTAL